MALSDWTELENLSGEIADSQSRLAAARSTQNHGLVKLLERQITEAEKWRDRLLSQITARLTTLPGSAGRRRDPAPAAAEQPAETVVLSVEPAVAMMAIDTPPIETASIEAPPVETAAIETAASDMAAMEPAAVETAFVEPAAVEPAPMDIALSVSAPVVMDAASLDPVTVAHRLEGVVAVWDQLTRADVERVKRELGVRRAEILSRHAEELRALDAAQSEIDAFEQTIDAFARKFNIAGGEVVVPFEGDRNSRGQSRG
jgi:hypothetical protein